MPPALWQQISDIKNDPICADLQGKFVQNESIKGVNNGKITELIKMLQEEREADQKARYQFGAKLQMEPSETNKEAV